MNSVVYNLEVYAINFFVGSRRVSISPIKQSGKKIDDGW